MNVPVTLISSLTAGLCGNVTKKYYTKQKPAGLWAGFLFNSVSSITAALTLLCWGGFGSPALFTVILGIVFGAVTSLQGIANITALQIGPMSYTSVIISFSTLISALSGVMFFHESLGWAQIVGIVLMLASFVLAAKTDGGEKKTNLRWLLLCLVAFAATGSIGIMQKVHQSSEYRGELNAFLIVAFICASFFSAIFSLTFKRREAKHAEKNDPERQSKKPWWFLVGFIIINGVCVAINNKFNLYLSGVMDSAVFFPIVNGGGLVLTSLAATFLFKERLTVKQYIGLALGIASVVFLCNPFA